MAYPYDKIICDPLKWARLYLFKLGWTQNGDEYYIEPDQLQGRTYKLREALEIEAEFLLRLRKQLMPDLCAKPHDSEEEETKGNLEAPEPMPGTMELACTQAQSVLSKLGWAVRGDRYYVPGDPLNSKRNFSIEGALERVKLMIINLQKAFGPLPVSFIKDVPDAFKVIELEELSHPKDKPGRKKVKLTGAAEGGRTIVAGQCAMVSDFRTCGEKCPFFYVTESRGATVVELRCVSASDPTLLDVEGFVPITEK